MSDRQVLVVVGCAPGTSLACPTCDQACGRFPELVGVNPHYVEGAGPGVNLNCASCVDAAALRLRGIEPDAVALNTGWTAEVNLGSARYGFRPTTTLAEATREMLGRGESAHASVIINKVHAINAAVRDFELHWVDTQSGHIVTLNPGVRLQISVDW